jgi:hypothetical protein
MCSLCGQESDEESRRPAGNLADVEQGACIYCLCKRGVDPALLHRAAELGRTMADGTGSGPAGESTISSPTVPAPRMDPPASSAVLPDLLAKVQALRAPLKTQGNVSHGLVTGRLARSGGAGGAGWLRAPSRRRGVTGSGEPVPARWSRSVSPPVSARRRRCRPARRPGTTGRAGTRCRRTRCMTCAAAAVP